MIVRSLPDRETALIGQTDHSRLVGQLAAHWGNDSFAAPRPYDSVMRAATYHDFGWLPYETGPLVNPENGTPYQFRELPYSDRQMAAYRRWVEWLTDVDPYAGLIVGRHRTGLWKARYGEIEHPAAGFNPSRMRPEINEFIAQQEPIQEKLAEAFDPGEVRVNYCLLQVWDLLGLYFCCAGPYDEYFEPVPTAYGDGTSVRMDLKPHGDWEVAFDPYPFDVRPLTVQIGYKALPGEHFDSQDEFTHAYFGAENKLLTYTLV
jgi:hypothetical protein